MAYTQAQLLTKLKTLVRDSANTKWTEPEMQEAIDEALVDPSFCTVIEDSSLTIVDGQQDYTIPATIDSLKQVYVVNGDGDKLITTGDTWTQINSTLRFRLFPDSSGTLTLVGLKQVTTSIPEEKINLALYLSVLKLYEMLDHKFSTGLLMSDITGAEIMNRLDYYTRKAEGERKKIRRITSGYAI